jgi:hypothetical protein
LAENVVFTVSLVFATSARDNTDMTESSGSRLRRRMATGCIAGLATLVVWIGVFVLAIFYWDHAYSRPSDGSYRPLEAGLADLGEAFGFGFVVASVATSLLAVAVALRLIHRRSRRP